MTDRELLELAAKAAGIDVVWYGPDDDSEPWCFIPDCHPPHNRRQGDKWSGTVWNPLTDDGDAFRLMVKLGIVFDPVMSPLDGSEPSAAVVATGSRHYVIEPFANDPYAATRRAIVRAAAAIGKEGA